MFLVWCATNSEGFHFCSTNANKSTNIQVCLKTRAPQSLLLSFSLQWINSKTNNWGTLPSRKLTYPTLGKGICHPKGPCPEYLIVPWRVIFYQPPKFHGFRGHFREESSSSQTLFGGWNLYWLVGFFSPIWKICASQIGSWNPNFRHENQKNVSNHHLDYTCWLTEKYLWHIM